MLIFKDMLFGFVVGVQLLLNDMLWIGDWIMMLLVGVDGMVIDIMLNIVKVVNFDYMIIMVLMWKLIIESYQNWCGMIEVGGCCIKCVLFIDVMSVCFLLNDEIECFECLMLLKDYFEDKVDVIV